MNIKGFLNVNEVKQFSRRVGGGCGLTSLSLVYTYRQHHRFSERHP